jgi:recombination protein RecT
MQTIRQLFEANRAALAMAIPRHLSVDRMLRTALTCFSITPQLLECSPRSLLGAVVQCAQLGLEPGILGMAYLVPFRDRKRGTTEVTLIPGYRGLLDLARRSGEISTIQAHGVRRKDRFNYRYGLDPQLDHIPSEDTDRGELSHVYAIARLKDGGVQFEVMTRPEIDAHRDRYSRASAIGPWQTEYEEMAKKTVLRKLCKLLPASIELHQAVALDEHAEAGLPQDLGGVIDLGDAPEASKPAGKLDELTEKLAKAENAGAVVAPAGGEQRGPEAGLGNDLSVPIVSLQTPRPEPAGMAGQSPAEAGPSLGGGPAPSLLSEEERRSLIAEVRALFRAARCNAKIEAALKQQYLGTEDLERADPAALADLIKEVGKLIKTEAK